MFIIGAIFIAPFVIRELTMRAPMLNLEVLKSSTFTPTTIINMVVMMSLFGGMILLPIYLQNLRGFSDLIQTVITSWFISDGYIRTNHW